VGSLWAIWRKFADFVEFSEDSDQVDRTDWPIEAQSKERQNGAERIRPVLLRIA
jgi:hypothetical protein